MAKTISFSTEVPCKVSAARLFECGPYDAHNHYAESLPHLVSEIANHQGDGSAGTIRYLKLKEGFPSDHLKMHTDVLDRKNFVFKFHVLSGGFVGTKLASAVYCLKITPTRGGGSICNFSGELTPLPGVEFTEKDVEEDKGLYVTFIKAVDKHLSENPDAYAHADAQTSLSG